MRSMPLAEVVLLSLVSASAGCVKDSHFSTPPLDCQAPVQANTTLTEFLASYSGGLKAIDGDLTFSAYVISSDKAGNFYKALHLQGVPFDPKGSGIEIDMDATDLYLDYPVGAKLLVESKGLYLSGGNGVFRLGYPYRDSRGKTRVGRIDANDINRHIHFSCDPVTAIAPEVYNRIAAAKADKNINTLVRLDGVEFSAQDIAKTYADKDRDANRFLIDKAGDQLALRSSRYADFAQQSLPDGSGSITGVMGKYGTNFQLYIRDLSDVQLDKPRFKNKAELLTKVEVPAKVETPTKTEIPAKPKAFTKAEIPTKAEPPAKAETPTKAKKPTKVEIIAKLEMPTKPEPQAKETPTVKPKAETPAKAETHAKAKTPAKVSYKSAKPQCVGEFTGPFTNLCYLRSFYPERAGEMLTNRKIKVIVTSDIRGGNIYPTNAAVQDQTAGITLHFDCIPLARLDSSLEMRLAGATLSDFHGQLQINVSCEQVEHIGIESAKPKVITIAQLNTNQYESMLVRLDNVTYTHPGIPFYSGDGKGTVHELRDETGTTRVYVFRGVAFASDIVPSGKVSVIGNAGSYDGKVQLSPRNTYDVVGTSEEKPGDSP